MNLTNKVVRGLAVTVLVTMMVGCASVGSIANKMVSNKEMSGVIYGGAGIDTTVNLTEICQAIKNKDPRCSNPENYVMVPIYSKFGYADGAVGISAMVPKDFKGLEALKHNYTTNSKLLPFVKARVIPGQLGELLEIVSTNGDGKCYWSGLPRVGGTVCPAYNWDYRKDNQAAIVFR